MDQFRGYRHPFLFGAQYFGGVGDTPRTLAELAMSKFSAELRRTTDWWKHFQNQDIREEWAEDARQRIWTVHTPSAHTDIQLSHKQIEYVLDELAGYAALRDGENRCQISCFERIWEIDSVLDSRNNGRLNQALSNFRDRRLGHTQREDNVTTALIDPFLHCLVYNKTLHSSPRKRLPRPVPAPIVDIYTNSAQFAFLPSEVFVHPSGSAKFTSYINNLHPQHTDLYRLLEASLTAFIPLFEHTLTDLHRNNPLSQRIPGPYRYTIWEEPEQPEYSDDEDGWATYERDVRRWAMNRPLHLPDVPDAGYSGGLEHRNHVVSLRGRVLQVIVSVSETRLQPGGPGYPGTVWHVEGMRNEHIVASGLYYSSVENLKETALQFRMAVTYPRGFLAGDEGATLRTWGLQDGDPCHQYIGSTPVRAGLGVTLPNIYQYRQTPCELLDPSKEGHQTVVAFFLVDPDIHPIESTATVAPQQKEWIRRAVDESIDPRVPVELVEKIMEDVEGLMEASEAEGYRKEFIYVRDGFRRANDKYHFCIPFDIGSASEFSH